MLWATVAVAVILSLGALAYVVWPLLQPGPALGVVDDDRLTELIARKDAVLTSIKELEFDYRVGKISDEDFERFNARLRRQAIGLIQQIEKLAPESATLDEQLEARIVELRKTASQPTNGARPPVEEPVVASSTSSASATPMPAPSSQAAPAKVSSSPSPAVSTLDGKPRFCTNCGEVVDPTHKFCANCGTRIVEAQAVTD